MAENKTTINSVSNESALSIIFPKRDFKDLGLNLLKNVVAPGIQTMLWNVASSAIYGLIYNNVPANGVPMTQANNINNIRNPMGTLNNSGVSQANGFNVRTPISTSTTPVGNQSPIVMDIWFDSQESAYATIARLREILDRYNTVSILDYYEVCGAPTKPSDNRYGWTYLGDIPVDRVATHTPNSYKLRLPPVTPIASRINGGIR